MRTFLLFLFLLQSSLILFGQTQRAVLPISLEAREARTPLPVYEIPLTPIAPFLAYFLRWEGDPGPLRIRFSPDSHSWSAWQEMPQDEHAPELPVSILGQTDAGQRFFQLETLVNPDRPARVECHFFSPGNTPSDIRAGTPGKNSGRSCSDLVPAYLSREEWCPAGNCPENPEPAFAEVTHLVIHHSAGSNQSSDWPAVVRSIWDFHVNGRGWADIGYNWLIDPLGQVYQGRGNDAIGAHFCGANTGTIGVCMLGDFMEVSPQPEVIDTLTKLLNWKSCENGIDPAAEVYHASSDKILPTIIGHRDGCATACPGDLFYPMIPGIRVGLAEDLTTLIDEAEMLPGLQVFPNPAGRQFNILLPSAGAQNLNWTLYNYAGQRIVGPHFLERSIGADVQTFDLPADLPHGTYLLIFRRGNQLLGARKLIAE